MVARAEEKFSVLVGCIHDASASGAWSGVGKGGVRRAVADEDVEEVILRLADSGVNTSKTLETMSEQDINDILMPLSVGLRSLVKKSARSAAGSSATTVAGSAMAGT